MIDNQRTSTLKEPLAVASHVATVKAELLEADTPGAEAPKAIDRGGRTVEAAVLVPAEGSRKLPP